MVVYLKMSKVLKRRRKTEETLAHIKAKNYHLSTDFTCEMSLNISSYAKRVADVSSNDCTMIFIQKLEFLPTKKTDYAVYKMAIKD